MFTQCPECQTTFRLRLQQLKAAGGQVRCSRCHSIFDALDHMVAQPRPVQPDEASIDETEQPLASELPAEASQDIPQDQPPTSSMDDGLLQLAQQSVSFPPSPEEEADDTLLPGVSLVNEGSVAEFTGFDESSPAADTDAVDDRVIASPDEPGEDLELDTVLAEAPVEDLPEIEEPIPESDSDAADEWTVASPEEPGEELGLNTVLAEAPVEDLPEIEEPSPEPDTDAVDEWAIASPDEPGEELELNTVLAEVPVEDLPEIEEPSPESDSDDAEELAIASPEEPVEDLGLNTVLAEVPVEDLPEIEEPSPESDTDAVDEWVIASPDEPGEELGLDTVLAEEQAEELPEIEEPSPEPDTDAVDELAIASPERNEEQTESVDYLDLFQDAPLEDVAQSPLPTGGATASPEQSIAQTGDVAWDSFSEQHIESLLTPNDMEAAVPGVADSDSQTVDRQATDNMAASEETPLPPGEMAPTDPPVMDDDEALLSQLLPEGDATLDQELDRLHLDSRQDAHGVLDKDVGPFETESPQQNYSLPPETAPPTSRSLATTVLWSGGTLLLLATLALQFTYFHRQQLAHHVQLRPLLEQLCQLSKCALPPQRDLSQIRLASHLVQFHPRYEESLLITASLINRADFTQPYPDVEVQMTDLQQQVVASRRFHPEEYLVGQRSDRPMPQNIEIPLMLEVLDPGKDVVGFRFEFY